uniref:Transcriptional regulating factor 1 n=1 Tax=Leptobrachium leishanense TaxID=445787 RepID=A0A8C5W7D7_9ANUR
MNNQQLYKANLSANSGDNLYYQHIQCQASNQTLNHSYDSVDLEESMSPSPHLALDTREAVLPNRAKSHISVDHARQTNWAHAGTGNHAEGRSTLDSYGQSLPWDSQVQNEATDAYHSSYFPQLSDNRHKVHSGGVHKLDSFTQVFAKRNLRIQASAQGIHEQQPSQMDTDSALRQLLTLKSTGSQQTRPPDSADRYQQAPQQIQHSIASQPQKHHLHALQHPQENYFYDYPQQVTELQSQSLMQQGQHFRQPHQGLAQQSQQLPPPSYYMQPHQTRQQRVSFQEIHQSQQQQFSSQLPPYYQTQSSEEELHHTMQQAQQHNMQSQGYHRDGNQKAESYAQDLSHPMQLIQLGAVPQNFYQNPQAYQHLNKQSMLPQQQASPQKPYLDESQSHVLIDTSVELSNADMLDGFDGEDMNIMGSPVSHHQALIHDAAFLMTNREPHPSPNTAWPQVQTSTIKMCNAYENPDSKSRLSCLICLKEFRSLPALNGHLKSHGGVRPSAVLKQDRAGTPALPGIWVPQPLPELEQYPGESWANPCQESNEVDNLTPIVMPVSVPVKLAPSVPRKQVNCNADMDQPESCVSDDEMPVLTRMTYSPPSSPKAARESLKPPTERRKYPHRPEPLFIPPPSYSTNSSYSGATLYQSQLRCPRVILDHSVLGKQELPLYTPPPMLSPGRQGSGLFNNVITACHNGHLPPTPLTPSPRVLLCQSNSFGDGSTPVTPGPGEKTVDIEPRINIGSRFQANIPELRSPLNQEGEQHKATLVWKPWPDLENQELRQKVEVFLSMSCSSVLPGGGTNLEYALHTLFEANGNILNALKMLLLEKASRLKKHPLTNYHYAGSDNWTIAEKKNFSKALNTYNKDFSYVQKMIKSKTVSQCVEYYYTWKKILRMGRRKRNRLFEAVEEDTVSTSVDDIEEEDAEGKKYEEVEQVQKSPETQHSTDLDQPAVQNLGPPVSSFICEMGNCGAVFCSRQALNGHARIHGGTTIPVKVPVPSLARQKSSTPSGYCSMKNSPAHSTTSGETDTATAFPCKVCGKVFFKIKSRNAHMKTHRQQEEQQRQKAQRAAEMADTIARTIDSNVVPSEQNILSFDHLNLLKTLEQDFDDNDIAQDLEDVLGETDVMQSDLLLDDEDVDLLQDGVDLQGTCA